MEYKIITIKADETFTGTQFVSTAAKLAEEVNDHIALGWEPQGGVCEGETRSFHSKQLFQALVKRR
ncbi:MAG: hypothetical protein K9M98_13485 [Cephaloticoccus sp.]|nr:hypothetical protein [Cephaloticoccus sp.]MCF7761505.1 hypothetical protein [Cephaloticoccus sp.]